MDVSVVVVDDGQSLTLESSHARRKRHQSSREDPGRARSPVSVPVTDCNDHLGTFFNRRRRKGVSHNASLIRIKVYSRERERELIERRFLTPEHYAI